MQNNIIRLARLFTKAILVICITFFVCFAGIIIHSQFSPNTYEKVEVTRSFKAGFGVSMEYHPDDKKISNEAIMLNDLNAGMVWWLLIRTILFFGLMLLVLFRVLAVLKSVNSLNTFYDGNVHHFQFMAKLGLATVIISCFNFYNTDVASDINFTLPFGPAAFMLACLVMAEVFKEGKQLVEDKNMII